MLDFQLLVTTARYQKTREARLAQEPINFNVYNVELPYGIVAHYPYGTLIADVRSYHELPKETAVKAPTTCSKLNEVQISTHLNFQGVPMLSQGANIATLPQILAFIESLSAALFDIWRFSGLLPAKALKQGDTAIIFIGDEPQACEVLTATKGIDKTLVRILVVDSPTWVKTTEIYIMPK